MIKLAPAFITAATSVMDGVTTSETTDTLRVSYVEIDFTLVTVMAMVERGTLEGSPSVFTPNMPTLRIQLNANGTFASTDGSWTGSIPVASAQAFVATLTAVFQAFILGAGAVTGTQI